MKSEIFDFMAMKSAFMGFSRYFHGIFMKKIFIVWTECGLSLYLNLSKSARACNVTSVSNFI